ncbi:hypothetical protein ACHAXS_002735 [Conticribra weissflogii]
MIKFSLISTFFISRLACGQAICPDVLTTTEGITSSLILSYQIIFAESADERDILCIHMTSDSDGFLGFAVAPSTDMVGGEAIIGIPGDNSVRKYFLGGKSVSAVEMRPDEDQTLMEAFITQDENSTILRFAKYLQEDGEIEIVKNGENIFLYAQSSSNDLGNHDIGRGHVIVDFMVNSSTPSPTTDTRTPSPTPIGSPGPSNKNTFGSTPVISVPIDFIGKTLPPTQGLDKTKPPRPTPAQKPNSETLSAAPTPQTSSTPSTYLTHESGSIALRPETIVVIFSALAAFFST